MASVMGSIPFSLYTKSLTSGIHSHSFSYHSYVDDTQLCLFQCLKPRWLCKSTIDKLSINIENNVVSAAGVARNLGASLDDPSLPTSLWLPTPASDASQNQEDTFIHHPEDQAGLQLIPNAA